MKRAQFYTASFDSTAQSVGEADSKTNGFCKMHHIDQFMEVEIGYNTVDGGHSPTAQTRGNMRHGTDSFIP